jgi:predicted phage tail protein
MPSYAFGGPVNTVAMGNPVGVAYGLRERGGAIISAGIYTDDYQ